MLTKPFKDISKCSSNRKMVGTKVGFIGLGAMGSGIALNLLKCGCSLVVNDINRNTAGPHLEAGAVWADSPREVAEASEVIFTSLPGPREVEDVALGKQGILEGVSPEKVYFDLSTISPMAIRRIHNMFLGKGVHVFDAPVSTRGVPGDKLAAIWVGGDKAIYEKYKHVLDVMADKPIYIGPIGAGSVAKLVHNCSTFMIYQALAETFTMGVKAGLDPLTLWKAVREGGAGRRRTFDALAVRLLPSPLCPPGFALKLAMKDAALAVEVGRELKVPMRLANLTLEEFTEAFNRGWGDCDYDSFMFLQEERSGVRVRAPRKKIQEVLENDE